MTAIVSGVYRNGHIELLEQLTGIADGPVRVILTATPAKPSSQSLSCGKYHQGRMSTLEDFEETR